MKKIVSIDLLFETCDAVRVQVEDIMDIKIKNIHQEVGKYCVNNIAKLQECDYARVVFATKNLEEGVVEAIAKYKDLIVICLNYEDTGNHNDFGDYDNIYLPWEDADDEGYENILQKTRIDGDVVEIEVGRKNGD